MSYLVRDSLPAYTVEMARGWESKSVEEQQAQSLSNSDPKTQLTPAQVAVKQKRDGLLLSRKRVLRQLEDSQNATLRLMLERALADLDSQLRLLT